MQQLSLQSSSKDLVRMRVDEVNKSVMIGLKDSFLMNKSRENCMQPKPLEKPFSLEPLRMRYNSMSIINDSPTRHERH